MKHKRLCLAGALVLAMVFIGVTFAQRPEADVDPGRHPNIAKAQHHTVEAFEMVEAAQKAGKDEFGGHLEKAKELLAQASHEMKEAAEFYNHNHK
jgi:hypothetical protein